MRRNNLSLEAFKRKTYAQFGDDFIRTIPMVGEDAPYIGYIKTTIGEAKVPYNSRTLFEVLCSGNEITKQDYDNAVLTAVNRI